MPGGTRLWTRWALRDLRSRWVMVVATAAVIGFGTGIYATLGSQDDWRRDSLNRSYSHANGHDVRLSLGEGAFLPEQRLSRPLAGVTGIADAQERLVVATQIDASTGPKSILVPGRLVGLPLPVRIDRLHTSAGRGLATADSGRGVVALETKFADLNGLAARGALRVAGRPLRYVGTGVTPDYFQVTSPAGWGTAQDYGIVFAPLTLAGRLSGHRGAVNEVVLRAEPGADPEAVARRARAAIERALPGVGLTTTMRADEDAYRLLYRDAGNDQKVYNVFALLVLLGAGLAAFNLVSRVVDSQRRQLGIGMALGVRPSTLGLRPVLLGVQIGVLSVLLGVGVGYGFGRLMQGLFEDLLPLPQYTNIFDNSNFLGASLLGLAIPIVASLLAVRRSVQMRPVDAIRSGARSESGGLATLLRRLPLPGRSIDRMPVRNLLRAPKRTFLTVVGIAAVMTTLVALSGMIDSMRATVDRSAAEVVHMSPERVNVALSGFVPKTNRRLRTLQRSPFVQRVEADLATQATLLGRERIDISLGVIDGSSTIWRPRMERGTLARGSAGIALSRRAAEQLGVGPGDGVRMRYPLLRRDGRLSMVAAEVPVAGVHENPLRFVAYMDESQAGRFGLAGLTNTITLVPASGVSTDDVKRALFGQPGVASVQAASADTDSIQKAIDTYLSAIVLTETIVLILALLVAFNSATISADERRRESATMFAFGMPLRSVMGLALVENALIGLLATVLGILGGMVLVQWILTSLIRQTAPDLDVSATISTGSLITIVVVGVVAVGLAPLFTGRRLRRMDIPDTLRVVE